MTDKEFFEATKGLNLSLKQKRNLKNTIVDNGILNIEYGMNIIDSGAFMNNAEYYYYTRECKINGVSHYVALKNVTTSIWGTTGEFDYIECNIPNNITQINLYFWQRRGKYGSHGIEYTDKVGEKFIWPCTTTMIDCVNDDYSLAISDCYKDIIALDNGSDAIKLSNHDDDYNIYNDNIHTFHINSGSKFTFI